MKVAFALIAASVVVAVASTAQDGGNYYRVPESSFAPGNNLSSDAIASSLQDTQDGSSDFAVPVAILTPSNVLSDSIRTSFQSPSIVPSGTKTYVAGLRATTGGNNFCAATLISPSHLLVGTYCASGNIRWASIGSHYDNGTQDGEQIKVVAILNHPGSSNANFTNDFAILKLETPSSFKPAALAAADDSDAKDGEWATKMGWDDTGGDRTIANKLTRADVQLASNEECSKEITVDDSMVCSRGATNETSCLGDYGGPLVLERPSGDVVIGVVGWGPDCGKPGYPSIYSRVSSAHAWIQSVVGGGCFH